MFDYNDLKAGQNWMDTIIKSISQVCQDGCFVILLSENANRSVHIRKELEFAIKNGCKRILPILIGDIEVDEALSYLLSNCQYYTKLGLDNNLQQVEAIVSQIKETLHK